MTRMSLDDAVEYLVKNEPIFELETVDIRGVHYKTFKNIPPHAYALLLASRKAQGEGAAEYLVFGDERWTFDEFINDINQDGVYP